MWPYKLVLHLLRKAVASGVNLQTNTPVESVSPNSGSVSARPWAVTTTRGTICTSKVVYASNAYTSAIVPEFQRAIVPVRGICCRITTPKAHPPLLSNSYILRIAPGEYDYLIPRTDGSIVVGGARRDLYNKLHEWYNVADDSKIPSTNYFDGYMQRHFRGWEDVS